MFCKNCGTTLKEGEICQKCTNKNGESSMISSFNSSTFKSLALKPKIILVVMVSIFVVLIIIGLKSKNYTCNKCDTTMLKAYYMLSGNKDRVLCKDCAEEYWAPLDYKEYRVK